MTQAYNLSQLANFVNTSGQLDALTGLTNTSSLGFPSGTRMSFNQTLAPLGWTKDTSASINDSLLRLVTGSASNGGSTAFSTFNSASTTGATTLTTDQMPSHTHTAKSQGTINVQSSSGFGNNISSLSGETSATGGGGSHTHVLNTNIKYYDFIIAQKD
jgi:hypothetical protein